MVTIADLVSAVREVAEAEPEFVYNSGGGLCSYFGGADGSACIVGRAMSNLGVDMDRLRDLEQVGEGPTIYEAITDGYVDVLYSEDVKEDLEHITWLGYVQSDQDGGMPWRDAVRRADIEVREGVA